jgi:uncharacterized protein YlxP (DUF503 family)
MYVGSVKVRLLIRESRSLKDKRQVVRSIEDRLRNGFNVAVCQVEALNDHRMAILGIVTVANDAATVRNLLNRVVEILRRHPVAEFLDHRLELERSSA